MVHPFGEKVEAQGREHAVHQELAVGQGKDHEGPEDDEVVQAERLSEDAQLAEGVDQHLLQAPGRVVQPLFRLPQQQQREAPVHAVAEKGQRGHQKRNEKRRVRHHGRPRYIINAAGPRKKSVLGTGVIQTRDYQKVSRFPWPRTSAP